MLSRFPIHHIPHGIDTDAYEPLDPEMGRKVLGIAPRKKVLMFGAQRLTNTGKGADLLLKAISSLPSSQKKDTVLLTMGEGGEEIEKATEMVTINLGYINSDRLKSVAYSAADLFLFPTRADIFGLVALEAISCGTPVVSFNIGGVGDLVRPGVTGYLAQPEDAEDFCHGILELLEDDNLREFMGKRGKAIVLEEYRLELQTKRYIELYLQVLLKRQQELVK